MVNKRTMEITDIIDLYQNGMGTTEIAQMANVSSRYIRQILTSNNIEKDPSGIGRDSTRLMNIILKPGQIQWHIYWASLLLMVL